MSVSNSSKVTREQLEKAAKLRAEGGTWNQIREATGTKLGSSQWFRAWEREGIGHAPAGQKPKRAAIEPTETAASTPKPERAARRPRNAATAQSAPEKPAKPTTKRK